MAVILTGFPNLDTLLGGFQEEDMIILTAPATSGPVSLVLSIVLNVAMSHQHRVGLFTLEMNKHQVVQRLLALTTGIEVHRLRTGSVNTDEYKQVASMAKKLSQTKIWIDDSVNLSIVQLQQRAQSIVKAHDISFLLIDNIHRIHSCSTSQHTTYQIPESEEVRSMLKLLAKTLNIPVLVVAPISLDVYNPTTAGVHSQSSNSSQKRDADHALFLYRDDFSQRLVKDKRSIMTSLLIANHQNGFVTDVVIFPTSHQKYSPDGELVPIPSSKNNVAS